MLDKKEKLVMMYLTSVCLDKKTHLVSTQDIAKYLCKKFVISTAEIDDIMISLSKDDYIDYVVSDSKKGYFYVVTLKNKGLTFKNDLKKEKQYIIMLVQRTLLLAILSFAVTMVLKLIF